MKEKYKVRLYYSGFSTHEIDANSEEEAFLKARNKEPDYDEILSSLESWKYADEAEIIKD